MNATEPPRFPSLRAANRELEDCPNPCHLCGPKGHHWYLGRSDATDADSWEDDTFENDPEDYVGVSCKHCEAEALIHIDAADLPEY